MWLGIPIHDWAIAFVACFGITLLANIVGPSFGFQVGGNYLFDLIGAAIVAGSAVGGIVLYQLLRRIGPQRNLP
jgi:hypothetical protein